MIAHAVWPVDPGVIIPILVAVALIELTPGPNMGWLALVSLARSRISMASETTPPSTSSRANLIDTSWGMPARRVQSFAVSAAALRSPVFT